MACSRFATVDSDTLTDLLQQKEKPNTKRSRELYWGLFVKYIGENHNLNELDLRTIGYVGLNDILMKYYAAVRTKTSELYKLKSYTLVHWAVSTTLEKMLEVNLNSGVFSGSYQVYLSMRKLIVESGKGDT